MINNYCFDKNSELQCSLATGSSISIFPNILGNNDTLPISWYNSETNSIVNLTGIVTRTLHIGSTYYTWTFFTADINYIILGADFIGAHFL